MAFWEPSLRSNAQRWLIAELPLQCHVRAAGGKLAVHYNTWHAPDAVARSLTGDLVHIEDLNVMIGAGDAPDRRFRLAACVAARAVVTVLSRRNTRRNAG